MMETLWPAWHPGDILRAEDLLGLEDYLLTRSGIAQKIAGVESLDADSIRLAAEDGRLHFSVGGVRGVTPHGQPVVLTEGSGLRYKLGGADGARFFDLSVRVNVRGNAQGDRPRKLTLSVGPLGEEDAPYGGGPEELYLGRYSWDDAAGRVGLVARPAVTHLGAIGGTEGWEQWTAPIRDRLSGLIARLEGSGKEATHRQLSALALAYRVGFGWPHMPIGRLSFNLQAIKWLLVDTDPVVTGCDAVLPLPDSHNSEALPMWLASHVDQDSSTFPGHELRPDRDVKVSFEQAGQKVVYTFLQGLRQGRLELHLRPQEPGARPHARPLWWKLDDGGSRADDSDIHTIDSRRDVQPQPSPDGTLIYSVRFSQAPQTGYRLTVSGLSREAFDRTRLFFIQSQA